MKTTPIFILILSTMLAFTSCVSKKKFMTLQEERDAVQAELGKCGESLHDYMNRLTACDEERQQLRTDLREAKRTAEFKEEQVNDLKSQMQNQLNQVEGLTELSQSATSNIKETLAQLERKDKYIHLLQAAKSRADSINLALAVNLKSVLRDGIEDKDVEVKVDKTVVFVNISDKMLYKSGSFQLTERANEVLQKIAQIVESRPDLEVMVEGYTDNVPIKTACIDDNWDLSVKRATSVVRTLQQKFGVDPNRLIAAGRGEWNTLATNETADGRSINRRTRIIILPKLNQFYDLLDPKKMPTAAGSTEE